MSGEGKKNQGAIFGVLVSVCFLLRGLFSGETWAWVIFVLILFVIIIGLLVSWIKAVDAPDDSSSTYAGLNSALSTENRVTVRHSILSIRPTIITLSSPIAHP